MIEKQDEDDQKLINDEDVEKSNNEIDIDKDNMSSDDDALVSHKSTSSASSNENVEYISWKPDITLAVDDEMSTDSQTANKKQSNDATNKSNNKVASFFFS